MKGIRQLGIGLLLFASVGVGAMEIVVRGTEHSALTDNIRAHLSMLAWVAQPQDAACPVFEEHLDAARQAVVRAGQGLSYYQLQIDELSVSTDCQRLDLDLRPGPRIKVVEADVALHGAGQSDATLMAVVSKLAPRAGVILDQPGYATFKSRLASVAAQHGYFDAHFTTQQIMIDEAAYTSRIVLHFDTGQRYAFGEVMMDASERAQVLISQVQPFVTGDPYKASLLGEFNRSLKETGYFQQVVARPLVNKAIDYHIPIELIATAKPRDTFNFGVGFSTDTGPRGSVKWQRPWVNRRGHSVTSELFLSSPRQSLTARYKIPLEDPLENYLSIQAGLKAEDDNDTNSETYTLAIQRHWGQAFSDWKRISFIRFEREHFQQGTEPARTTDLLIPGATLSRHRIRGGLDVHWGDRQLLTFEVADRALVSDIDFSRLTFSSAWLRSYGSHRLTARLELGAIATNDFQKVPSSLRYFAGGDQSVRGFAFESLAPRKDGKLEGGRYLNVASVEYSYPVSDQWRLMTFVDVGNATNTPFDRLARGVGAGVSWQSPVGPIRLYLARGHSEWEQTWRLHFAMGPAL
ncbi:autotransporter assembly complex protein TamA [Aestuariibacter halophilus]|uniref:Autotransporter assembly complex protein TamA n=1 Tax=Fluctibacter halophilus TaxID=226011 RepID=A0ABS8GAQ7_9ALTE|nr:autotransporter assembly complex family protein [Aestuariibacter halophilus]MCC2617593.1 autotransporter assembly complex protein TamA [Aestuariibacter halophilus]